MRYWLLVLNEDDFAEQQTFEVDSVQTAAGVPEGARNGDEVALAGPAGVFALGELDGSAVSYRRRLPDPAALDGAVVDGAVVDGEGPVADGWTELQPDVWESLVRSLPAPERRSDWMVSLSIPVEAADRAEAVRQFWTYTRSLGPTELPTFVSPYGQEIDGTAFLLGAEHEQDPEEE